jgi:hypothetical protein
MTEDTNVFRYYQEVPKYIAHAPAGGSALEAQIIADALACAEQCNAAPTNPLNAVVAWKPSEKNPDGYVRAEVVLPAIYYPYINPELVAAVSAAIRGWMPEELTEEYVSAVAATAVKAVRHAGRLAQYDLMRPGHYEPAPL